MSAERAPVRKRSYRNQQSYDLSLLSYQYLGVDLFSIDGVSHATAISFISEVGLDIFKFPSAKHFVSWLRLSPNNKISGGKLLSSRTPKGKHPLALVLRNAANTIGMMKEGALKNFFSRIAYKKGRAAAITATARKLAAIIWHMVTKQQPFLRTDESSYKEKIKTNTIREMRKKMKKLGLTINDLQVS